MRVCAEREVRNEALHPHGHGDGPGVRVCGVEAVRVALLVDAALRVDQDGELCAQGVGEGACVCERVCLRASVYV